MGDPNAAMFSRSLPAWCTFVPLAMIGSLKGSVPPPIAAAAPSCKAVQFGGPLYAGEPMASLSAPLPGYGAPPIIPSSSFWFKPTPRTSLSALSRLANSWAFLVLLLKKIEEVKKLVLRTITFTRISIDDCIYCSNKRRSGTHLSIFCSKCTKCI